MQKKLLILGSLGEFVELTKKSKSRGYYTIICDGYPEGPAREFADEQYTIRVDHIDEIAELCREKGVDAIITSYSDLMLECMVKIADKAGIPCYLSPDQLDWYRDKAKAKELLSSLGLPAPAFKEVETHKELTNDDIAPLQFPIVTKPTDKYGSRGIYYVRDLKELNDAVKRSAEFTDKSTILLEEYNPGYELNIMCWVCDGKVYVLGMGDREKTLFHEGEIPIATRIAYPSRLKDQAMEPARQLLQSYVDKTGQKDGALCMQFFWSKEKGIQVCEIAARFFGYEHPLINIVYGFDINELLLNYAFDKEALKAQLEAHNVEAPKQNGAVLYFHGRLKELADITSAKELANHPSVVMPWIFYEEGESIIEFGKNPYFALYYICAPTREELDASTEVFFENMSAKGTDGEEVLYKNKIPEYR